MNEVLSKLIRRAQGDRSQNTFAKDCGIDSATITRIVKNGQVPTPQILKKIGDHAQNGVSYNQLMVACGYLSNTHNKASISVPRILARQIGGTTEEETRKVAETIAGSFDKYKQARLPNFQKAIDRADELLIQQKIETPPIDVKRFRFSADVEIAIDSYKNYCDATGLILEDLLIGPKKSEDGFTVAIDKNRYLILYNENKPESRQNWTLAHELGHVYLGHIEDNDKEEVEANFFAAELLMPTPVLREIIMRGGVAITPDFLSSCFKVSLTAAQKKVEYMKKSLEITNSSMYGDILIGIFQQFIDRVTPQSKGDLFDEMEKQNDRNNWY